MAKFATQFKRLAEVLARDATGLELRSDPTALAPERLLVFEIRGSVRDFAKTIQRVAGLELIDEDELAGDESDKAPALYLMVPDQRALAQLLLIWERWQAGTLVTGQTQWGEVFGLLRALRTWGPQDRINGAEADMLAEEIEGCAADETVSLEIELVYRRDKSRAEACESEVKNAVSAANGKVIARARIEPIAYHALLVSLAVADTGCCGHPEPFGAGRNCKP